MGQAIGERFNLIILAAASEKLDAPMAAFRVRFGTPPHVFGFPPETWPRRAAMIREAVVADDDLSIARSSILYSDEQIRQGSRK